MLDSDIFASKNLAIARPLKSAEKLSSFGADAGKSASKFLLRYGKALPSLPYYIT